tara:strand:+ start:21 stop:311 length:291 start_codon:yes stop_codon:yes gene_type:complete
MARKRTSSAELKKRRDEGFDKLKKNRSGVKFEENRKKNTGNTKTATSTVSSKTKQGKKRTPAQLAAAKRLAAKKAGTYKAPMTAKEKAKKRLKIKK